MIPKASIGIRDSKRTQAVPSVPPSFVKSAIAAPTTAADSHAIAFSGGVTAGNLIIVAVATFATAGSGEVASGGVTDSLGNVYSRVVNVQGVTSTAMWLSIHVAQNILGGACTVTANAIGTAASHTISVHEYSGAVLSNAVDASAIQRNASSTSAPSPTTSSTTIAADLIFAAMTFGGSTTTISAPSTGYTQRTEDENGSTVMPINTADKTVAATGTQIATWTLGAARESLCGILAIKGSGTGAAPDTQDPSSFTLSSPSQTSSTISLLWTAATDNIGVVGYDIYVEGSFHSTTTSLSATIGGLSPSTSYSIYVDARDAAGNTTASNSVNQITSASESAGYYVASNGSDSNNGTSSSTPWLTIAKVNSFSFSPGANIFFRRGDTWGEQLTISSSGSSANPITFAAYGSGAKPILSGFTTVSAWTSLGGGIYESTSAVTSATDMNLVTFNGVLQPMGRWPKLVAANKGYLSLQSHTAHSNFTSNAIASAVSFVGGEVVYRAYDWVLDRGTVTAQTSTVVTYTKIKLPSYSFDYEPVNGGGFFFQNHASACTELGEWTFNRTTKKLKMYFGGASPASYTIKVTTRDVVVNVQSNSHIKFDNLHITGANEYGFLMNNCNNIQWLTCDIDFIGATGIENIAYASNTLLVNGCTIDNCNNNGIFGNYTPGWTIQQCALSNCGMIRGMGLSGAAAYEGICLVDAGSLIEYNTIENMGYNGIDYRGDNVIIRYNFIDYICMILQDGAGIYTYGLNGSAGETGRQIYNNIVLHSIGDFNGKPAGAGPNAHGIYADAGATDLSITNNTVAFSSFAGLHMNWPKRCTVTGNTFYDNGEGDTNNGAVFYINQEGSSTIRNMVITNNIAFAKRSPQLIWVVYNNNDAMPNWGTINSNYYCRPILEPQGIATTGFSQGIPYNEGGITYHDGPGADLFRSLDTWKSFVNPQDANTVKTPMTITDVNDLRFEYNATNSAVVIPLPFNYMDARGVQYNGEITLQPWTSAVLIKTGSTSGYLSLPPYTGTGQISPGIASRSGASNFTISGVKFRNTSQGVNGGAGLILTSCNNVIIENCWFDGCAGTNPPSNIAALTLTSCTNITVRNCVFSNCSWGILAHQTGTSGIKVLDNEFINMVGSRAPYGCCRGQAVYYAEFTPSAGNEIKRNKIMNFLGEAWQDGDILSIYKAGGTSGSHLVVEENIIYGSIGGRNGCAIIVGDQSSGPLNVDIFANRIFKHAIAGISVSGGSFITERNNRVWAERNEWSGNAYNAYANPTPCSNIDINTSNLAFSQLYNLHPSCPGCREDAYFPGSCTSSSLAVGSLGSTAAAAYTTAVSGISDPSVSSLLSTDDFMRVRADKTWYTEIVNHGNVGVVDGTSSHRRVDCTRPVANAGVDQNVSTTTAQLNGSGSSNTNPTAPMTGTNTITHRWTQVSGPNTATMGNSNAAINNLSNLINGTYVFRLDVTQTQTYNNTTFADSVNYQTQHSDWVTIIKS